MCVGKVSRNNSCMAKVGEKVKDLKIAVSVCKSIGILYCYRVYICLEENKKHKLSVASCFTLIRSTCIPSIISESPLHWICKLCENENGVFISKLLWLLLLFIY